MAELKPCPFCGGEAEHLWSSADGLHIANYGGAISWGKQVDHHIVRCKKCGIKTKVYAKRVNAEKAWNRRSDGL